MPLLCRVPTAIAFVSLWIGMCLLQTGTLRAQATQELPIQRKLVASMTYELGSSLAVSGDVLVAASTYTVTVDNKFTNGAVYVFVRDQKSGEWIERKRLVPQLYDPRFDNLLVTVDGDTIVVGSPKSRIGGVWPQGVAYVFERHQGGPDNWGQVARLTEGLGDISALFGGSVAIKGDLLAIGAPVPGGAGSNGRVTIYQRDRGGPGAWGKVTTLDDSVVGDGGTREEFGSAVAIDGDLLLVGAGSADVSYFGEDDGAAYVFRRDAADRDRWNFVARLTAPEAALCPGGRTLAEISLESPEVQQEVERCARRVDSNTEQDGFGKASRWLAISSLSVLCVPDFRTPPLVPPTCSAATRPGPTDGTILPSLPSSPAAAPTTLGTRASPVQWHSPVIPSWSGPATRPVPRARIKGQPTSSSAMLAVQTRGVRLASWSPVTAWLGSISAGA